MNEYHDETSAALRLAFGAAMRGFAELIDAWQTQLPPEKRQQLASFGAKGLTLGLSFEMPQDRPVIVVTLRDTAGATVNLDTIELRGASLAIN